MDNTGGDGRYKALFLANKKGKYKATVYLHGAPVQNDFVFMVDSPRNVDRQNLRKYFSFDEYLYVYGLVIKNIDPIEIKNITIKRNIKFCFRKRNLSD